MNTEYIVDNRKVYVATDKGLETREYQDNIRNVLNLENRIEQLENALDELNSQKVQLAQIQKSRKNIGKLTFATFEVGITTLFLVAMGQTGYLQDFKHLLIAGLEGILSGAVIGSLFSSAFFLEDYQRGKDLEISMYVIEKLNEKLQEAQEELENELTNKSRVFIDMNKNITLDVEEEIYYVNNLRGFFAQIIQNKKKIMKAYKDGTLREQFANFTEEEKEMIEDYARKREI